MRDYYARYFREVGRDLSWFTKGQIVVSLIAGIGAAFVGNALGTITDAFVWKSAGVGVICYVGILAVRAAWSVVNAPVKLDRQRQTELGAAQEKNSKALLDLNNGIADERGRWAKGATDMNADLAACREQLARKHPSDEVKERHVRDCLTRFKPDGIDAALTWLVHQGEAHELDILPGHLHAITRAHVQTSPKLVIAELALGIHNRRPSQPQPDRVYKINPEYKQSLSNVLFSTD